MVNGSGNKIGTSIVLKVMAGDKVDIRANSWYRLNGTTPNPSTGSPVTDLVTTLANGAVKAAGGAVHGATSAILQSSGTLTPGISNFLIDQTNNYGSGNGKPKAFINWILFDEQFKYVAGSSSSADPVGNDQEFKTHLLQNIPMSKNGFLYIYESNETPNVNVFFDNLQATHTKGPLVEETHYYPFGLVMQGISSRAANGLVNKRKFNKGSELQNEEFSDGSGLEWYDVMARTYDPQLGRFMQIDPIADEENQESWSVYHYSYNNPLLYNDPDGKNPILGAIIGAFTEYAGIISNKMLFENMSFSQANSDLGWGDALDITIAAGFGAASGALDGGITKFASWAKSPTNQKILVKLLEVGVSALESSLKAMFKDEDFDLMSILSGALAEVGLGSLLKTNIHKNAADNSTAAANAATKKADDLAKRKKPNERLVNNKKNEAAQQKKNAKLNTNLDNTGKVIKGSTAKTGSNAAQNATKKKKEKKKTES